jgi:hypothetical protein
MNDGAIIKCNHDLWVKVASKSNPGSGRVTLYRFYMRCWRYCSPAPSLQSCSSKLIYWPPPRLLILVMALSPDSRNCCVVDPIEGRKAVPLLSALEDIRCLQRLERQFVLCKYSIEILVTRTAVLGRDLSRKLRKNTLHKVFRVLFRVGLRIGPYVIRRNGLNDGHARHGPIFLEMCHR